MLRSKQRISHEYVILRHFGFGSFCVYFRYVPLSVFPPAVEVFMPQRIPLPSKKQFSVALLIETSSTYGRQILRGIHRYIQTENQQDWLAVLEERDLNSGIPAWIRDWSGDGIISRQTTADVQLELKKTDIAFIDLNDRVDSRSYSTVRSDDLEIGRLAAEHLQERGLEQFAFCGFENEYWSELRESGFRAAVTQDAQVKYYALRSDWYARDVKLWEREKVKLTEWLQGLPKPIGILAANDIRGKQIVDCCYQAGIQVPEQVAVVGVDNDEITCNFCHTALTSVMPNAEGIGFRAAQLLSGMLERKSNQASSMVSEAAKLEHIVLPPLGVFARQSSDIVAVDDEDLAAALKYIRNHACDGITVADVIEATGMSRSTIERKMRNVINRSPQQEIRRVQLKQVCTLLAGTDMSIEAIALQCGYEHPEYLHVVFKREMEMTPGEYRNAIGC